MDRPSREQVLMDIAKAVSSRATCRRRSVGAVVARNSRVIITGYNGPPAGTPHCDLFCDMDNHCTRSLHAEENLIAFAARYGTSLEGTQLYITLEPCIKCARLILAAGISEVIFQDSYLPSGVSDGFRLLSDSGVTIRQWKTP
jgi:dCMP deaminase